MWTYTPIPSSDEIYHSGKKGMKWGYTDGHRNGNRTADFEDPADAYAKYKNGSGNEFHDPGEDYEKFKSQHDNRNYNRDTSSAIDNYNRGDGEEITGKYTQSESLDNLGNAYRGLQESNRSLITHRHEMNKNLVEMNKWSTLLDKEKTRMNSSGGIDSSIRMKTYEIMKKRYDEAKAKYDESIRNVQTDESNIKYYKDQITKIGQERNQAVAKPKNPIYVNGKKIEYKKKEDLNKNVPLPYKKKPRYR